MYWCVCPVVVDLDDLGLCLVVLKLLNLEPQSVVIVLKLSDRLVVQRKLEDHAHEEAKSHRPDDENSC